VYHIPTIMNYGLLLLERNSETLFEYEHDLNLSKYYFASK